MSVNLIAVSIPLFFSGLCALRLKCIKRCDRVNATERIINGSCINTLMLFGYQFFLRLIASSSVLINLYRDFDWAGIGNIFTLCGYPYRTDVYHPRNPSWQDNGLICLRTFIVGTVLIYFF